MTGPRLHSKTAGAKQIFDFRASHFATIFALGLILEKPQLRDFVGVWKAAFQGKTFTALTLKLENDKLAGTLSTGEVDLAPDGEVSNVNQEVGEPRAIFDIKLDGQILSFKDKDGDDVNSLEMKLTGENRAELRFLLPDPLPQGMPVPKPFRLTRTEKLPHISNAWVG